MKTASSGVPAACRSGAAAASAAAASSAPVAMCSTKIAITASTAGSAATCSTAARKPAGDSAATSWTGPATTDCGGSSARSAAWVSRREVRDLQARRRCTRRRTRRPARARCRRSPRRRRAGSAARPARAAASSSSSSPSQRITPALANSASTVLSEAAISAPVCELAARAPADVRPALTASTGLARATRRATRPNLRGLPKDSRYSATTCVAGSCSQYCRTSLLERSALSPSETNALQADARAATCRRSPPRRTLRSGRRSRPCRRGRRRARRSRSARPPDRC